LARVSELNNKDKSFRGGKITTGRERYFFWLVFFDALRCFNLFFGGVLNEERSQSFAGYPIGGDALDNNGITARQVRSIKRQGSSAMVIGKDMRVPEEHITIRGVFLQSKEEQGRG
jgi:hypothetical protein